jgi:hypothetical protein
VIELLEGNNSSGDHLHMLYVGVVRFGSTDGLLSVGDNTCDNRSSNDILVPSLVCASRCPSISVTISHVPSDDQHIWRSILTTFGCRLMQRFGFFSIHLAPTMGNDKNKKRSAAKMRDLVAAKVAERLQW